MDTSQNEVIVEEELGQDYNPEDEDIVLFTMKVAATATHRTVFIIVIKKGKKQFFSFQAISDVKIFGLQKISDVNIFRHFFCPKVFALDVITLSLQRNAPVTLFVLLLCIYLL